MTVTQFVTLHASKCLSLITYISLVFFVIPDFWPVSLEAMCRIWRTKKNEKKRRGSRQKRENVWPGTQSNRIIEPGTSRKDKQNCFKRPTAFLFVLEKPTHEKKDTGDYALTVLSLLISFS